MRNEDTKATLKVQAEQIIVLAQALLADISELLPDLKGKKKLTNKSLEKFADIATKAKSLCFAMMRFMKDLLGTVAHSSSARFSGDALQSFVQSCKQFVVSLGDFATKAEKTSKASKVSEMRGMLKGMRDVISDLADAFKNARKKVFADKGTGQGIQDLNDAFRLDDADIFGADQQSFSKGKS